MSIRSSFQSVALGSALALLLAAISTPALAQAENLALKATATNSSSWEDGTAFDASKANDGDPNTRWNAKAGDQNGAYVDLTWPSDVTFNKVAIDEDFNRVREFELQVPDGANWKTIYSSAGININPSGSGTPTYTVIFPTPVIAKALRFLVTNATTVASIFEFRVYNTSLGTLSGKVTDEQGNPIANADVSVGGTVAKTNAQGVYTLTIEAGQFDVTAGLSGEYRSRSARNVTVGANATVTQDFSLLKLPTNLARTATATSSSDYSEDYDAPKANDGNPSTRWNSAGGDEDGSWLALTWDTPQTFNTVSFIDFGSRVLNFSIQKYDETKNDYVDLAVKTNPAGTSDRIVTTTFSEDVTAKEIRLLFNDVSALASIYEFEVTKATFGSVAVKVVDNVTGNPVAGATVLLDPFGAIGTTDAQGNVSATVIPNEYLIRAQHPDYFDLDWKVLPVNVGQPATLTLQIPAKGPNLAQTGTLSASTEDEAFPVANIRDGDVTTYWRSGFDEEGADAVTDQWVAINYDQPITFNVIGLEWGAVYPVIQKSSFQYLNDAGQWVDIPGTVFNPETMVVSGKPSRFVLDQPLTTKGVRYFMNYTNGVTSHPTVVEFVIHNAKFDGGVTVMPGDINGDGKINVQDATLSLRIAVGLLTPDDKQKEAGDVNNDGKWNIQDTTLILQVAVGNKPASDLK